RHCIQSEENTCLLNDEEFKRLSDELQTQQSLLNSWNDIAYEETSPEFKGAQQCKEKLEHILGQFRLWQEKFGKIAGHMREHVELSRSISHAHQSIVLNLFFMARHIINHVNQHIDQVSPDMLNALFDSYKRVVIEAYRVYQNCVV